MQVNAISSFNSVNFRGKTKDQAQNPIKPTIDKPGDVKSNIAKKAPWYMAALLLPIGLAQQSCEPRIVQAVANAEATIIIPRDTIITPPDTIVTPPDTIIKNDTIVLPGDTIYLPGDTVITPPDTIYMPGDTIITPGDTIFLPGDTIVKNDTIYLPGDTIITPGDTIYMPGDTIVKNDTIYIPGDTIVTPPDTIIKNDTIVKNDTVYIPQEFEFPYEIQDSLNIWRRDMLDIPASYGDDETTVNKALLYATGKRNWEYKRPETIALNLARSSATEAWYDHTIGDNGQNDLRVTLVKPGELTIVTKDGTETNQVGGLLFNENGIKTFMHSNGQDKIYVYSQQTSGDDYGKYVYKCVASPGYLNKATHGNNFLVEDLISLGTEEHYSGVNTVVFDVEDLIQQGKKCSQRKVKMNQ